MCVEPCVSVKHTEGKQAIERSTRGSNLFLRIRGTDHLNIDSHIGHSATQCAHVNGHELSLVHGMVKHSSSKKCHGLDSYYEDFCLLRQETGAQLSADHHGPCAINR